MRRIRRVLVVLSMLLCGITPAAAQVSIGIGTPHVAIGINVPVYPALVTVPNYPVYYAPQLRANYFFYDGLYWVYERDSWHASAWYNGPWAVVHRDVVPAYVLRVPVRYYRAPPAYFAGWRVDVAPLWGVYWGNAWAVRRAGWDRWDRTVVVARAPLPVYQRAYAGPRYPTVVHQTNIHINNYNYYPRETVVRTHYKEQVAKASPDVQKTYAAREATQAKQAQRKEQQARRDEKQAQRKEQQARRDEKQARRDEKQARQKEKEQQAR